MNRANTPVRPWIQTLLLGAVASMATLSAAGAGPRERANPDDAAAGVVRIRRGGGGGGGERGVDVTRSPRAAAAAVEVAPAEDDGSPTLSPSGSIAPDPGGFTDQLEDLDPIGAGLPDSENGEPQPAGPGRGQEIAFFDIGVRGKRSGRTIILWGAEFAFVDCEIVVADGLPVGYTGAIGQVGPNPGSAPMMQFTLECGGEITLTVQPAANGSLTTPSRPVRTVTMQVP